VTWTPPEPGSQPPPPNGPAAKLSWRLGHSVWVLAPILSFGCLGAAGFLYVGIRARKPQWWIPGVAYSVVAWVFFILGGESADGSTREDVSYAIFFAMWAASVVHALIINPAWLRWRAGYRPWYSQAQPPPMGWPTPPAPPLPPQMHGLVPGPQQYYAGPQEPRTTGPQPYYAGSQEPRTTGPQPYNTAPSFNAGPQPYNPGPVEVNTADAARLATLPHFNPERVAHVLAVRKTRGGFVTLNDFAAAAGLAPHELVAVRDRIVVTPPPPEPDQPGPYGRIVDV
jgi:hypothetical protein